ncbi:MAG: phytoene/squalene synthase family protein [Marmoricola sp.]
MSLLSGRRPSRTVYDAVCERSAALVIQRYSSSFGLASRLLGRSVRAEVCNVYALVRIADEIVDNPDVRVDTAARACMLKALHDDVRAALLSGYSPNVVVHAFAGTARRCGITGDLIDPFFASMTMDLHPHEHTAESLERYVYGSAEVVGLMCLRVFLAADPGSDAHREAEYERLAPGARRLGAAFQKLNFLRDLAEDHDVLGRRYFPGLVVDRFCDADRDRILADIQADLIAAAAVIPALPASSRRAVLAAHATFAELAARLGRTPAAQIRRGRVRVPDPVKARVVAGALWGAR